MDGDEEFEQARFFEGEVIADSSSELSAASVEGLVSELVVEDSASFRLLVRDDARGANQWVGKVEAEYGDVWGFRSRADAEKLVDVFTRLVAGCGCRRRRRTSRVRLMRTC